MSGILDVFKPVEPSPLDATVGARAGFGDSFVAAFENQAKNWSTFGAAFDLRDRVRAVASEQGVDLGPWFTPARSSQIFDYVQNGKPLKDDQLISLRETMKTANEADANSPTFESLVGEVQASGEATEFTAQKTQTRSRGLGAFAGTLAGSMVGSFTPADPFNILTLPAGGVGKTLLNRLATEFGANAAIEGINQFTGVPENRRQLGLSITPQEQFANTVFAGMGAAAFRGIGEGIGFGLRTIRNKVRQPAELSAPGARSIGGQDARSIGEGTQMPPTSARAAAIVADDIARIERSNPFGPATDADPPLSRYETAAHERVVGMLDERANVEAPQTILGAIPYRGAPGELNRFVDEITPGLTARISSLEQKIDGLMDAAARAGIEGGTSAEIGELSKQLDALRATRNRIESTVESSVRTRVKPDLPQVIEPKTDGELAVDVDSAAADMAAQAAVEGETAIALPSGSRIDLDLPIILEKGAEPVTLRSVLNENKSDADLVDAMRSCLL
jgi:hypothetical protein